MSEIKSPFTTFNQAVEYLYTRLPLFQNQGPSAYKPDLGNIRVLLSALGDPHVGIRYVHVGGTNGKGSSSHMLAAILQSAGYKTGLYTSPHLKSFTERIRVNGVPIPEQDVVELLSASLDTIDSIQPSFFEVTTTMAFQYFQRRKVDVAVIEVGLGGRLDATNIITPVVSLITNIGHDHLDLLGPGLEQVAFEKAGIIKKKVPVVISERQQDLEKVFIAKAQNENAELIFASDHLEVSEEEDRWVFPYEEKKIMVQPQLRGSYQKKNIAGVVRVVEILRKKGFVVSDEALIAGIENTSLLTGLKGRWQVLQLNPKVICDTGHNPEGIQQILEQLSREQYRQLHWVFGVVGDKPAEKVLKLLPSTAKYYFCAARIPRAMPAERLSTEAASLGLKGEAYADVQTALVAARKSASADDLILVGGSTYVVAEVEGL